jgi:hypothetical protein
MIPKRKGKKEKEKRGKTMEWVHTIGKQNDDSNLT